MDSLENLKTVPASFKGSSSAPLVGDGDGTRPFVCATHSFRQEASGRIGRLTERQTEVLDLIIAGYASKKIAYALHDSIAAARVQIDGELIKLPVKLRVHCSVFVPMAKWCMLMAGNYRCLLDGGIVSIRNAVHGDLSASRAIFDAVAGLCKALGAEDSDLVPFDKYASAALSLESPSSVARALAARVDARLVTNRTQAA
jgi:DNA-binding CsgD family transcriptional regulator